MRGQDASIFFGEMKEIIADSMEIQQRAKPVRALKPTV